MSRVRIHAKVRGNPEFVAVTTELDRLGLPWTLEPPRGKGHPIMLIEVHGRTYRRPIACTPKTCVPSATAVSALRRWLREREFHV